MDADAVLRLGDAFSVMDDACPHAGGSLSGGLVDGQMFEAPCVICPWHGWPFDVQSGECPDNPSYRVNTYASRVLAGRVEARLNPRS